MGCWNGQRRCVNLLSHVHSLVTGVVWSPCRPPDKWPECGSYIHGWKWLKKKKAASLAWWKKDFPHPKADKLLVSQDLARCMGEGGRELWIHLYPRLPNLFSSPSLGFYNSVLSLRTLFLPWELLWGAEAKFSLIKKGSRCVSTQIMRTNPQIIGCGLQFVCEL